jgi:hypothetical protein
LRRLTAILTATEGGRCRSSLATLAVLPACKGETYVRVHSPAMETQVVVALIALAGVVVGYLVRPVGDLLFDVVRERRATAHRDRDLQFQTLVEIQTALVTWKTFSVRMGGNNVDYARAKAVLPALAFRVKDDRLRELIETLLAAPENRDSPEWTGAYGNAMRRLGEVMRHA